MSDISLPEDNFICDDSFDMDIDNIAELNNANSDDISDTDEEIKVLQLHKQDKKALSIRLEEDEMYRRKYIKAENDIFNRSDSLEVDSDDTDMQEIIKIVDKTYACFRGTNSPSSDENYMQSDVIRISEMSKDDDSIYEQKNKDVGTSVGNPGVYIARVDNLTINITL